MTIIYSQLLSAVVTITVAIAANHHHCIPATTTDIATFHAGQKTFQGQIWVW
jgi:hypothetical protein